MLFKISKSNYINLFLFLKIESLVKTIININRSVINKNNYLE